MTLLRSLQRGVLVAINRVSFSRDYRGKYRLRAALLWAARTLQCVSGPQAVDLVSGYRIRLDLEVGMCRWILTNDCGEAHLRSALAAVLRPGMVFVDVGANIGHVSLLAAQYVGRGGLVAAFEPGKAALDSLRHNVCLNSLGSVIRVFDKALGALQTSARLVVPGPGGEDVAFIDPGSAADRPGEQVEMTTLDHEMPTLGRRVNLIKIDVEGLEWDVLRGGASCLERDRPSLIVELSRTNQARYGYEPEHFVSWLRARRYALSTLEHALHPFRPEDLDTARYLNVLCTPTG